MTKKGYRKCDRCGRNRQERFFRGQRGKVCETCRKKAASKAAHERRVRTTYGLGPGEYDKLFEAQDGKCAICREPRSQRLSVDHCHTTNRVRGLLCRRCNGRLLTAARDRPEVLRNAADYLEDPPAIRVIGERLFFLPHSDTRQSLIKRKGGRR